MSIEHPPGLSRRDLLVRAGATALVASATPAAAAPFSDWKAVRAEFPLRRDHIHMALMLIASHPRPVREAIERHRRAFDENPAGYFEEKFFQADAETRAAAARYTGGAADDIALTDSTTMGLGLLYGGLPLKAGDEVVTSLHDHYATHENLRLVALRTGATVKKIPLYEAAAAANEDDIVKRVTAAIGPRTRAVALTWVHSSTGVKLPIKRIAQAIAAVNSKRGTAPVLLCVDGVHGFAVESETPVELGCDFFSAGCHKWLFGPRGTGILWGKPGAWKDHGVLIASFEMASYGAWMKGEIPKGPMGPLCTPGGFHSFEHRWALGEAFAFHERLGRARVTARVHELARQAKEGLAKLPKVKLHTPMADALSASLICFEVEGVPAAEVVKRLHARKILASVTPYATEYARLSPSVLNTPAEIESVLRVVREIRAVG